MKGLIHDNGIIPRKVSAAVGQDTALAVGKMDVETRYRNDEDEASGVSTPTGLHHPHPSNAMTTYGALVSLRE